MQFSGDSSESYFVGPFRKRENVARMHFGKVDLLSKVCLKSFPIEADLMQLEPARLARCRRLNWAGVARI